MTNKDFRNTFAISYARAALFELSGREPYASCRDNVKIAYKPFKAFAKQDFPKGTLKLVAMSNRICIPTAKEINEPGDKVTATVVGLVDGASKFVHISPVRPDTTHVSKGSHAGDPDGPLIMPYWFVRPAEHVKAVNMARCMDSVTLGGVTIKVPTIINAHQVKKGDELLGPVKS